MTHSFYIVFDSHGKPWIWEILNWYHRIRICSYGCAFAHYFQKSLLCRVLSLKSEISISGCWDGNFMNLSTTRFRDLGIILICAINFEIHLSQEAVKNFDENWKHNFYSSYQISIDWNLIMLFLCIWEIRYIQKSEQKKQDG